MSGIDENEVWAFIDEAGAIFQDATGRDLNDFDSDDDWQECCLKYFREMADELKRHGVRWDSDVGYISKLDEMRLVAANRDALRLERDTLQTSLHAAREELSLAKPFAELGRRAFDESREDMNDVCGGDLQDWAVELGILVPTKMEQFCGEDCHCTEYYGSNELPIECLRYSENTRKYLEQAATAALLQNKEGLSDG